MMENKIIKHFALEGEIQNISPYGEGHINRTFLVTTNKSKYIFQKINTVVFKNPKEVMENISNVTEFLKSMGVKTLSIVKTLDGSLMHSDDDGFYRVYEFIDGVSYQQVTDAEVFKKSGEAFGKFQNQLADFDASCLHETIKQFHDTPKRFRDFCEAVEKDAVGRLSTCRDEVEFVMSRKDTLSRVTDAISQGTVPLRVTHNDTKLNNILMNSVTNEASAIIDLDTVMPGSMLYDFGDSIRFGASTAAEDEKDLEKVHFSIEYFKAYAEGFCSAVADKMTDTEKKLLPYSAYLMTIECGMRFLTDYLSGDVYFGIKYPEHNLDRCHTQFKLAYEMQQKESEMLEIIENICNK